MSSENLITRDDTLLGICQGLSEDLGFNPLFLRMPLAVGLLWNPSLVFGTYLGLGVIVLLSRLIFPAPRVAVQPAEVAEAVAEPAPASPAAAAEPERLAA